MIFWKRFWLSRLKKGSTFSLTKKVKKTEKASSNQSLASSFSTAVKSPKKCDFSPNINDTLPELCLLHIFSYLAPVELLQAQFVCKHWCHLSKHSLSTRRTIKLLIGYYSDSEQEEDSTGAKRNRSSNSVNNDANDANKRERRRIIQMRRTRRRIHRERVQLQQQQQLNRERRNLNLAHQPSVQARHRRSIRPSMYENAIRLYDLNYEIIDQMRRVFPNITHLQVTFADASEPILDSLSYALEPPLCLPLCKPNSLNYIGFERDFDRCKRIENFLATISSDPYYRDFSWFDQLESLALYFMMKIPVWSTPDFPFSPSRWTEWNKTFSNLIHNIDMLPSLTRLLLVPPFDTEWKCEMKNLSRLEKFQFHMIQTDRLTTSFRHILPVKEAPNKITEVRFLGTVHHVAAFLDSVEPFRKAILWFAFDGDGNIAEAESMENIAHFHPPPLNRIGPKHELTLVVNRLSSLTSLYIRWDWTVSRSIDMMQTLKLVQQLKSLVYLSLKVDFRISEALSASSLATPTDIQLTLLKHLEMSFRTRSHNVFNTPLLSYIFPNLTRLTLYYKPFACERCSFFVRHLPSRGLRHLLCDNKLLKPWNRYCTKMDKATLNVKYD